MGINVGVVASTPTVRRGLLSVLEEAGFEGVPLAGLEEWVPRKGGAAVLVVATDPSAGEAIRLFWDEHPHVPIIAITTDGDVGTFAEAIRAGAVTAVAEDSPTEHLVTALVAALDGWTVFPTEIARAMATRVPPVTEPGAWVSDAELGWLRSLAEGTTVPTIAEIAGYSEREMFRVLQRLYQRVGVSSRTEAIIWATKNGLL